MNLDPKVFQPLASLSLWFKVKASDTLSLADVPKIIPLRWLHFRENFSFIKKDLLRKVTGYSDTDQLSQQLEDLDEFILEHKASIFKNTNPFSDQSVLYKFYSVFESILIDSLAISEEEQRIIDTVQEEVKAYSRDTFIDLRKQITEVRDVVADQVGLSDDTYNTIKNRVSVTRNLTADFSVLFQLKSLQDAIKAIDYILANEFSNSQSSIDPFAVTRANLQGTDIKVGSYNSGYLVPFNYGDTLEKIAHRYLGSSDRWMDVAIANGLKPPYIDEVGFAISLKSDGYENTVVIDGFSGLEENIKRLYLNQPVFLSSSSVLVPEQRIIIGIRAIDSNSLVLELDGAADLDQYSLTDNAKIRAFKAETINSNFFILIPRSGPVNSNTAEEPFFLKGLGAAEKNAKVDLALDEDGDIQFTATGDLKLSYGIANALQALKLKLSVELGSLKRHPRFGLVNVIGQANSDVTAVISAMSQSIDEQVRLDKRFDRVESIDINYNHATLEVELSVRLAGSRTIIPIVFKVSNS